MPPKMKLFRVTKPDGEKLNVNADMFDMNVNGFAIFIHAQQSVQNAQGRIVLTLPPNQWIEIAEVDRDTMRPAYESTGTIIH